MKAVVIDSKNMLKMVDTDKPQATDSKLVIKVERAGICGSDLHIWENGTPAGLIMGHEFSGTIVEPGSARQFQPGDRVTAIPGNPCMECKNCKSQLLNLCVHNLDDAPGITTPGAFAEYVAVSPVVVHKLPDNLSMDEGAMVEPSSVALHSVRLGHVAPGDKVLIVGAGIIGLLCAAWARICGASYIALSELNPVRREKALAYGDVDEVFDAAEPKLQKKLLGLTDGGFDKTFECAGPAPAVQAAIGATGYNGTVVLVGVNYSLVPISTMRVNLREIDIRGSYGFTAEEFQMSLDFMARGVLKTKRFVDEMIGLDGLQTAFEKLHDPAGSSVKILVKPY
ncbi:MAG: alcohol dehydrogenase catalytic domain-containing protein [Syntrophomonadaceae bacterium]|nr:alcohol dehydrogenase catalytic domain-containing protein [Syntrophomonadaceae bacterium]